MAENKEGKINSDLGGFRFGLTSDGQAGYRKPGADTVIPFSSLALDTGTFDVYVLGQQAKDVTVKFKKPFKSIPDFGAYNTRMSEYWIGASAIINITKEQCTVRIINRDESKTATMKWIAVGEV